MDSSLTKVPMPLAFLALGIAGLAGLVGRFAGAGASLVVDAVAVLVLACLGRRIVRHRPEFAEQMRRPTGAAVFAGAPYALILIAGHLAPYAPAFAFAVWVALSAFSALYILWFTLRFAISMKVVEVEPSIFVPYCAVGVVGLSSGTFRLEPLRAFVFLFVLVSFAILGAALAARLRRRPLPEGQEPMLAIACAPMSMAAAAYLSLGAANPYVSAALVFAAQILFFLVLAKVPSMLAGGFRPANAALTFPFALTATAAVDGLAALKSLGLYERVVFTFFAYLETAFATVMIVAVLGFFLHFLTGKARLAGKLAVPAPCIVEV